MNLATLVSLANKDKQTDEATEFGLENMSEEIKAELQEMIVKDRKDVVRKAASEILSVLRTTKAEEDVLVSQIRTARASIVTAKAKLDEINRAKAYAKVTDNYIPLACLSHSLTSEVFKIDRSVRLIPDGWTPTSIPLVEPPAAD